MVAMRVQIRRLRIADFKGVKKIERVMLTEYRSWLKQTGRQEAVNAFIKRKFLEHYVRKSASFVAIGDDGICGFILSQPLPCLMGEEEVMWLEYVAVSPRYRRMGVAIKLLTAVINRAKGQNIRLLQTTVNPDNPGSQGLLRKLDFEIKDWKLATKNRL